MDDRHRILRSIADKERMAGFIKRQRVGLRAEQVARILPRANGLDDFVLARVNHTKGVAPGIGHHHILAVGGYRQGRSSERR